MENGYGFGICRLPVVPVMQGPGWAFQRADEMLFGEPYRITGPSSDSWLPISCSDMKLAGAADGWIHTMHHHGISADYYALLISSDFRIATEPAALLLFQKIPMTVLRGSLVPLSAGELFKVEEQLAFNGEAKVLSQRRDAEFLCELAKSLIGVAELPGGRTPFGMDPVGWVTQCIRLAGIPVGTGIKSLRRLGEVSEADQPEAGNLCFLERGADVRPGFALSGGRVIFCDGTIHPEVLDGSLRSSGGSWALLEARKVV